MSWNIWLKKVKISFVVFENVWNVKDDFDDDVNRIWLVKFSLI